MIQKWIEKWKKHSVLIGLIFTLAAGVFTVAMTYVAYVDQQAYWARLCSDCLPETTPYSRIFLSTPDAPDLKR